MEKKRPVLLFLGVLVCLLIASTSTTSGHVVNPGAAVRGFIIPQPDFADLNEGIACVLAAEIGVVPEHDSKVTGVGFLIQDNAGTSKEFELKSSIPAGKMTNFTLSICYQGKPGEVVPKARVQLTLNLILVDSPNHGGVQQLQIADPPPSTPQSDTITLR